MTHPMPTVFIYCDAPSHSGRRVAVTNFDSVGEGRWIERYTSTAAQGARESGVALLGDEVPSEETLLRSGLGAFVGRSDVRSRTSSRAASAGVSARPAVQDRSPHGRRTSSRR